MESLNFFRKLPRDLTHTTTTGAILSILTLLIISVLVAVETTSYLVGRVETSLGLDLNSSPTLPVTFDISLFGIPCEFASVDAYDFLGAKHIDVQRHITKHQIAGHRGEIEMGRYRHAPHVIDAPSVSTHSTHHHHGDPIDRVSTALTSANFSAIGVPGSPDNTRTWAFINFHAPWCPYCQQLAPTWEQLAAEVASRGVRVGVHTVNCVTERDFCRTQGIMSFPTLRLYQRGQPLQQSYNGARTVQAMLRYVEDTTGESEHGATVHVAVTPQKKVHQLDGCRVVGRMEVNRVPGSIRIHAKSDGHSFDAATTNVSHHVRVLAFGDLKDAHEVLHRVPHKLLRRHAPLNGETYVAALDHHGIEHYVKVVTTVYQPRGGDVRRRRTAYQMVPTTSVFNASQVEYVFRPVEKVPAVGITYDLSPTAIVIAGRAAKEWYEFATNLCGLVGGMFAVMRFMDSTIFNLRGGNGVKGL